jgi:putative phosphoesterase
VKPIQRFGILGDIHSEDETLAAALEFLAGEAVDAILAVGDIVDGAGSAVACCRLLVQHGALAVRGNHDRWFLEGKLRDLPESTPPSGVDELTRAFLASLPPTRLVETPLGTLLLCHGTGDDDMHAVRPDDFGLVLETNEALQELLSDGRISMLVCGHSHRRMVRRIGSLTILNAGTLRRGEDPTFGIVDLRTDPHVSFFERVASGAFARVDTLPIPLPSRAPPAT